MVSRVAAHVSFMPLSHHHTHRPSLTTLAVTRHTVCSTVSHLCSSHSTQQQWHHSPPWPMSCPSPLCWVSTIQHHLGGHLSISFHGNCPGNPQGNFGQHGQGGVWRNSFSFPPPGPTRANSTHFPKIFPQHQFHKANSKGHSIWVQFPFRGNPPQTNLGNPPKGTKGFPISHPQGAQKGQAKYGGSFPKPRAISLSTQIPKVPGGFPKTFLSLSFLSSNFPLSQTRGKLGAHFWGLPFPFPFNFWARPGFPKHTQFFPKKTLSIPFNGGSPNTNFNFPLLVQHMGPHFLWGSFPPAPIPHFQSSTTRAIPHWGIHFPFQKKPPPKFQGPQNKRPGWGGHLGIPKGWGPQFSWANSTPFPFNSKGQFVPGPIFLGQPPSIFWDTPQHPTKGNFFPPLSTTIHFIVAKKNLQFCGGRPRGRQWAQARVFQIPGPRHLKNSQKKGFSIGGQFPGTFHFFGQASFQGHLGLGAMGFPSQQGHTSRI